jgi:hypothetical protein
LPKNELFILTFKDLPYLFWILSYTSSPLCASCTTFQGPHCLSSPPPPCWLSNPCLSILHSFLGQWSPNLSFKVNLKLYLLFIAFVHIPTSLQRTFPGNKYSWVGPKSLMQEANSPVRAAGWCPATPTVTGHAQCSGVLYLESHRHNDQVESHFLLVPAARGETNWSAQAVVCMPLRWPATFCSYQTLEQLWAFTEPAAAAGTRSSCHLGDCAPSSPVFLPSTRGSLILCNAEKINFLKSQADHAPYPPIPARTRCREKKIQASQNFLKTLFFLA